jgi:L-asparagine oxygenase
MTSLCRIVRFQVEDGIRDLLGKEIAERVSVSRLDSDVDDTILANIGAHALRRYLPGEILRGVEVFTASDHHALSLANLPTQDFPETPVHGFGAEPELAVMNAIQLGLIRLLDCTPFAVSFENDGRLIRNVVPNPDAAGRTSSWGADAEFFWHSDNPHQPFGMPGSDPRLYTPHYLTFYAVRNEERVPTELMAVEDLVVRLDPRIRAQLASPRFDVGAPDSNDAEVTWPLKETPLLDVDPMGRNRMRYDRGTTSGTTPEAVAALDRLCGAIGEVESVEFVLQTGEFMIFDNHRVLHRRRAFTPRPNATARWLRRCYVS